ncbi:MAG TPA: long-chain fatty acid--CoA ligase [Desulfitobacterium dehalogenans]|uniref:Long-chain fatty acid--CoA ligase n=1 Tax=Desulfitobacterium dehalogenans TaxID=36854 RepID=A0A7C6Z5B0_9FIRM|nr:long-chain fatty acid--CoA ligase [Desulfitobacterium dehalogenans]
MSTSGKPWINHYPARVRHHLDYPDKSLGQVFDETVANMPDTIAMIFADREITYSQFGDRVNRLATAIAGLGIGKGDRIGLMGPNCPQWIIAYFALLKLGVIVVQTNPMYVEREIIHQMKDSGASGIIVFEPLYPRVKSVLDQTSLSKVIVFNFTPVKAGEDFYSFDELIAGSEPTPPAVPIDSAEDIAVLQYTGGTTGVSKGVMLTHRNLICNTLQVIEWAVDMNYGDERIITLLPVFHVYGMTNCVNYSIAIAATQIILPRFDVDMLLETIQKHRPTLFPGAPTMFLAINNHPRGAEYKEVLAAIKVCNSGSAPLPLEVAHKFAEITGGSGNLQEGYGLSEASPVTHSNPLDRPSRAGSIGLPLPDTDSKIVDLETGNNTLPIGEVGELCIRGPQVMKGYWEKPEETEKTLRNGWLHTGDIAKMDEDGYFYIIDRKKDMIIAGGYNIYPRDIEEVLYEHPKVKEVVAAGIPDSYRGETVKAYIVLKPDTEGTAEEFIEYCRTKLAAYKIPRQIEFREALPRTIVGKVLRRQLVAEELAKIKAAGGNG